MRLPYRGIRVPLVFLLATLAVYGCERRDEQKDSNIGIAAGTPPQGTFSPPAHARGSDEGQWTMASKDYANTRYSELNEINTGNASRLRVAWTFSTGVLAGHEAAPLVLGSTMYVVTPFPNFVYALDLAASGALKWQYDPKPAAAARGVACCDVVNRGLAFWNGSIILNTLDGRTIALDAETGQEKWVTPLGDINRGETMTMAPLVVKDKVLHSFPTRRSSDLDRKSVV